MKKKILIQRIAASNPEAQTTKTYEALLRKNCELVKDGDTEITIRLLRRGLNRLQEFAYSHLHYLNDREVFEAVLQGEKDGFDAVIVYCFSDPALDEMRQALRIPIIGLGQSSMMTASLMGAKFGLVAMSPASVARNEQLARRYGFFEKIISPIRPLPLSLIEQEKMITNASAGLDAFQRIGREYIQEGAEVLIAACGALNLVLKFCPGCSELPDGMSELDGVPIIDSVSSAVKYAEMLVEFKKAGIPWISRKGSYSQPADEITAEAFRKMKYDFGGVI
ncbi:MAG: aspartate/glutamate racemase family protein [Syntrophales bacterium]|jgi:allantoin racemase|nr:aspartate/glutamate racemase family protein [Syntrophales bacterium]